MLACLANWAFNSSGSVPNTLVTEKQKSDGDGQEVVVDVVLVLKVEVVVIDVVIVLLVVVKLVTDVVVNVDVVVVVVDGWHGGCDEQRGSRGPNAPLPLLLGFVANHRLVSSNK